MAGERTNSPISDPQPYSVPKTDSKPQPIPDDDWSKLSKDKKYPLIKKYLEDKKEFYRKYMPDGTAIQNIPDEHLAIWWKAAATIIAEIEAIEAQIFLSVNMRKQRRK